MTIDAQLLSYATVRQVEYLEAIEKHGGVVQAARALGCAEGSIRSSMAGLKSRAARQGYSPEHGWTHPVPSTHVAKGVSTYYQQTETTPAAWVKADLRQEAYNELVREAIAAFVEGVQPIDAPEPPRDYSTDVIPWIQIGDAHVGMLAHAAEVGENFDIKIAERELCGSIGMLIDECPPCERIVINDLGDGTHYDNMAAVTAASGHALDADGRLPKMIRAYSRIMRFVVERALTKARFVDVIINQGNHSRVNDTWMPEVLDAAYGHTGRVHVLPNDNVFIPYRMGNTLVMVHHSDKCPPARLVGVMTTDYRKDFGETEFHYIDIGHVHHHFVSKEHPSVVIESWNHQAASDKWAHDAGYRSRKSISVVLRSKTYGDIGRRHLSIKEIRDRLEKAHGPGIRQPERVVYSV
jgi:hypothetical protein